VNKPIFAVSEAFQHLKGLPKHPIVNFNHNLFEIPLSPESLTLKPGGPVVTFVSGGNKEVTKTQVTYDALVLTTDRNETVGSKDTTLMFAPHSFVVAPQTVLERLAVSNKEALRKNGAGSVTLIAPSESSFLPNPLLGALPSIADFGTKYGFLTKEQQGRVEKPGLSALTHLIEELGVDFHFETHAEQHDTKKILGGFYQGGISGQQTPKWEIKEPKTRVCTETSTARGGQPVTIRHAPWADMGRQQDIAWHADAKNTIQDAKHDALVKFENDKRSTLETLVDQKAMELYELMAKLAAGQGRAEAELAKLKKAKKDGKKGNAKEEARLRKEMAEKEAVLEEFEAVTEELNSAKTSILDAKSKLNLAATNQTVALGGVKAEESSVNDATDALDRARIQLDALVTKIQDTEFDEAELGTNSAF
jgi:hypothetical protein